MSNKDRVSVLTQHKINKKRSKDIIKKLSTAENIRLTKTYHNIQCHFNDEADKKKGLEDLSDSAGHFVRYD